MKYVILVEQRKDEAFIFENKCYSTKKDAIEALRSHLREPYNSDEEFEESEKEYGWDFEDGQAGDEEETHYVIELEEK